VAVVTPYAEQVRLIREKLRNVLNVTVNKPCPIEVNTVDGFQGREKDCVIVSTVRAAPDEGIGFLRDSRRMNVTLTRARQNLWVVGSRATLARNSLWASFIEYIGDSRILEVPKVFPGVLGQYYVPSIQEPVLPVIEEGTEDVLDLEEID
jgi:superfamily I DNA and/or RNA helicase